MGERRVGGLGMKEDAEWGFECKERALEMAWLAPPRCWGLCREPQGPWGWCDTRSVHGNHKGARELSVCGALGMGGPETLGSHPSQLVPSKSQPLERWIFVLKL